MPDLALAWGSSLRGFADIWLPDSVPGPATAALHLGSGPTDRQMLAAIDEILRVVPQVAVEVSLQQPELVRALTERGFRRSEGPWFAQLWRSLTDLSDLPEYPVPRAAPSARFAATN